MKSLIMILMLLIFVSSCDPPYFEESPYSPTKQSLANAVRRQAALHLEKENGLIPCGTAGQMMDEIKMLGLSFVYYGEVGIEEARELLIIATTSLLMTINSNELIRHYLYNYPFTPKNIEIAVFLRNENKSFCDLDKLHLIQMMDGKLEYFIRSSETNLYKTIYTETFEEALKNLKTTEWFIRLKDEYEQISM
jgi:hypothetical protein